MLNRKTCFVLLCTVVLYAWPALCGSPAEGSRRAVAFRKSDHQVIDVFNEEQARNNPVNISKRMGDITAKATDSDKDAVRAMLKKYDIVFVPGLISDVIIAASSEKSALQYGGYFSPQMKWLTHLAGEQGSNKIDRINVESEGSVEANADMIRAAILKRKRRVVLVGHSKGGLDTLDMLVHFPDARARVAGWIAIQSPFMGSPLADATYDNKALRLPTDLAFQILGGSDHSLHDLSTATRARYYRRHKKEIDKIVKDIPHFACVTWIDEKLPSNPIKSTMRRIKSRSLFRKDAYSFLKITRDYMLLREDDLHNDGMVPRISAALPGSDYVAIEGPDHGAIVGDFGFSVFTESQRCHLVASLLALLAEDMRKVDAL